MVKHATVVAVLALGLCGCGGDLRVFDVTIRTVRNCHPAGLIPQLCDDAETFAGRTRTAQFTVEVRGQDFILYDESGRALAGNIERTNHYFARSSTTTRQADGCQKESERNVKFFIERDWTPNNVRLERDATRIWGTRQDRANQSLECGQAVFSKFEEAFEGTEVVTPWTERFSLPGSGG
jgi:hypothetical protein